MMLASRRPTLLLGIVALLLLVNSIAYADQRSEPVLVRFGVKSITTSTFTPSSPSSVLHDPYTNALTPSSALAKLNDLAPVHLDVPSSDSKPPNAHKQTTLKRNNIDVLMLTLDYSSPLSVSSDFSIDNSFTLSCSSLELPLTSYSSSLYTFDRNNTSSSSSPMHLLTSMPGYLPAALSAPDLAQSCAVTASSQHDFTACEIESQRITQSLQLNDGIISPYANSLVFVAPLQSLFKLNGQSNPPTTLGDAFESGSLVLSEKGLYDANGQYCTIRYSGKGLFLNKNSQLSTQPIPLQSSAVSSSIPFPLVIPTKLSLSHNARLSTSISARSASYISLKRRLHVGDAPGANAESLSSYIDEPFFLQLNSKVGGFVPLVVKPAVGGLTKPVLDITSGMLMDAFVQHFVKKLYGTIITEVGTDVGLMLGHSLRANLTATVADAMVYTLTESLQYNLVRVIAPVVTERMLQYVPENTAGNLNRLLFDKISKHVLDKTPELTARGLKMSLTHGLTRAITHSLVPVLTHSIGHHKNSDYYCHHCYYAGAKQSCALCHFSARSVYYQIYYGAYYADYYSKYYTGYYTQAVRRVDELTHKLYNNPGASVLPQTVKYLERAGRPIGGGAD